MAKTGELAHRRHTSDADRVERQIARSIFLEQVRELAPSVLAELAGLPFGAFQRWADNKESFGPFGGAVDPDRSPHSESHKARVAYEEAARTVLASHDIDTPWMLAQAEATMADWWNVRGQANGQDAIGVTWGHHGPLIRQPTRNDLSTFQVDPIPGWSPIFDGESREDFRRRALAGLDRQISAYLDRFERFLEAEGTHIPGHHSKLSEHVKWFVLYQLCDVDVRALQKQVHRSKPTINAALKEVSELLEMPRRYRRPGRPTKKV